MNLKEILDKIKQIDIKTISIEEVNEIIKDGAKLSTETERLLVVAKLYYKIKDAPAFSLIKWELYKTLKKQMQTEYEKYEGDVFQKAEIAEELVK